jgi:amidase
VRFEEYRRFDAVALAGLVRKGEVSAGELLDVAIARAEAVNPKINAIVHKQYEQRGYVRDAEIFKRHAGEDLL